VSATHAWLETLTALGGNAEARLYIGFDKHAELA